MLHRKQQAKVKQLEHTADIGLLIKAADKTAVFTQAAIAMFDLIGRLKQPAIKSKQYCIDIKAANLEELLVAWLSELLTLADIHKCFFIDFKINILSDSNLNALCQAVKFNKRNIERKTEVKAVTYHELKIKQDKQQVTAKVFFDL